MGLRLFSVGRSESGQRSLPNRPLPSTQHVLKGYRGHFPCWSLLLVPLAKLDFCPGAEDLRSPPLGPPAAIALLLSCSPFSFLLVLAWELPKKLHLLK